MKSVEIVVVPLLLTKNSLSSNNGNTREMYKICAGVFIFNLKRFHIFFLCFHWWIWTGKCQLVWFSFLLWTLVFKLLNLAHNTPSIITFLGQFPFSTRNAQTIVKWNWYGYIFKNFPRKSFYRPKITILVFQYCVNYNWNYVGLPFNIHAEVLGFGYFFFRSKIRKIVIVIMIYFLYFIS